MFDFALLIPIFAIAGAFSIPLVRMLISHQQKMAELIHSTNAAASPQLERMRQDLDDLRAQVNRLSIVVDDLSQTRLATQNLSRPVAAAPELDPSASSVSLGSAQPPSASP